MGANFRRGNHLSADILERKSRCLRVKHAVIQFCKSNGTIRERPSLFFATLLSREDRFSCRFFVWARKFRRCTVSAGMCRKKILSLDGKLHNRVLLYFFKNSSVESGEMNSCTIYAGMPGKKILPVARSSFIIFLK